jgi:3-hydroxyisobutyrate dehydrogenase-like beta-hydroxyacid dehydrogenase
VLLIKLGKMGKGVARQLLDRDYPVVAYSRTPGK